MYCNIYEGFVFGMWYSSMCAIQCLHLLKEQFPKLHLSHL